MRLTAKLIRHILLPAIVLALFIGGTYRYYNLQHARTSVQDDLARTGQIVSELIGYRVKWNEQQLTNLLSKTEQEELVSALGEELDPMLQGKLEDACGRVLANAKGALAVELFDSEGRLVLQVARDGTQRRQVDGADEEWFPVTRRDGHLFSWEEESVARLTHRYDIESTGDAYGALIFDVADIAAPTVGLAAAHGLGDLYIRFFGLDKKLHLEMGTRPTEDDTPLFATVQAPFCEGMIELQVPSTAVQAEVELYETQVLTITSLIFFVLFCSIWVGLRDNVLLPVDRMMGVVEAFQRGEKTPAPVLDRRRTDELDDLDHTLRGAAISSHQAQELLNTLNKTLEERVADRTRELRAAHDAAQAANRAKTAFLANISHEIRTPLNGILGMTLPLVDSELDDIQAEAVDIIKSSGESLLSIINDILDISRIEAGKMMVARVSFDLKHCLESIVAMLRNDARAKGIELRLDCEENVPSIYGDPGRIRQLLVNLVSNGIKFTEEGHVNIVVRVEESSNDTVALLIQVEDTGIGIEPDKLESIFEPFSQADTSMARQYGGAGLGLTISQQIVDALGGSFEVESEVGKGSTFSVRLTLDVAATPEDASGNSRVGAADGTKWRILVVDDSESNLRVAEYQLERLGCEVECVGTGRQAVERLERNWYHLVFMDCQLPIVNGYEITRQIRDRGIAAGTPIVAMTAHAMQGDREKCLSAGMDDYLPKPFGPEQVQHILTKWLAPSATSLSA